MRVASLMRKYLKNKIYSVGFSGVLILLLGLAMTFYGFPKIVRYGINQRIVLKQGTEGYEMWRNPPFPLSFKVYLFNVTNPDGISNGSRPRLRQVGPYVYDQVRYKDNIRLQTEGQMVYDLRKELHFNSDKSGDLHQDDELVVLNVPLMGLLLTAHAMVPSMMAQVNMVVPQLFNSPEDVFLRTTVHQLLFQGIFVNCSTTETMSGLACEAIKNNLPSSMRATSDPDEGFLFSMFHQMNTSTEGPYSVDTGLGPQGVMRLGEITTYQNSSLLDAWEGRCAQLKGTDSTIFPPFDESRLPKTIHIFQPDICRSLYAGFKGRGQALGLPAVRYEVGRALLESKETNAENECFCPRDWSVTGSGCEMDGVMGLEECQGAPVVISYPHFYLGSPALLEFIEEGLSPNRQHHLSYIDIEPKTGAVIRGAKRLQFNMELAPLRHIEVLEGVPQGLLPILWVEEGAEINYEVKILLESVYTRVKIIKVVQWIIVGVGVVMLLAACRLGARGAKGGTASLSVTPYSRPGAAHHPHKLEVSPNRSVVFSLEDSVQHK